MIIIKDKVFNSMIQICIYLSLIGFTISTIPNLSDKIHLWLNSLEVVTVIIFTFEYIIRIRIAENRWKYIFSFIGIVDLLSILPFYIALGVDLRSIKFIRIIRLLRVMKITRYSQAFNRLVNVMKDQKEEFILFFSLTGVILYISSVGIYYFEHEAQPEAFSSIFASLWWAIITLTTVGYGDVYAITVGGKIFTFIVLMLGLGIIAVPTGLFASALSNQKKNE